MDKTQGSEFKIEILSLSYLNKFLSEKQAVSRQHLEFPV